MLRDVVERRRRLIIIIAFGEVGSHSKNGALKRFQGKEITRFRFTYSSLQAHRHERDVSNERERETMTPLVVVAFLDHPGVCFPFSFAHFSRRVIVKNPSGEKVRMDDVPKRDGRVDRLRRALARPGATGRRGDVRFARGRDERRRRPDSAVIDVDGSVPIGAGVSRRVETLRNGPQKRRRRKRRGDDGMSDTKKRKWNDDA